MFVAIAVALLVRARLASYILLVVLSLMIGWWRGSVVSYQLSDMETLIGQEVTLSGYIAEDPNVSERGDTRIVVKDVFISSESVRGLAWVTVRGETGLGRGDRLVLNGKASEGFGPYMITLSYPKIIDHIEVKSPIRLLREAFTSSVRRYIVEPAASLGLGFVIGQRSSLPNQLDDQLRAVGLTHMIVASGYNLTILVRFAKRTLERRSKYLTAVVSFVLMLGFIAVSGASPSMIRAGLVTGLSLLAWYYGRKFHPLLLIIYVMALTAMYDPMYLWADIGWWLSFLAFAGVLMLAPLLGRWLASKRKQPGSVMQIAIETSAAQIMTLPLIMLIFGQLPLLSVIANILAAPFVPLAMLLTFLAGLSGALLPGVAAAVALPAEIILSYFIALVEFLAAPSWALIDIGLDGYSMVVLFVTIALIMVWLWRRFRYDFRSSSVID